MRRSTGGRVPTSGSLTLRPFRSLGATGDLHQTLHHVAPPTPQRSAQREPAAANRANKRPDPARDHRPTSGDVLIGSSAHAVLIISVPIPLASSPTIHRHGQSHEVTNSPVGNGEIAKPTCQTIFYIRKPRSSTSVFSIHHVLDTLKASSFIKENMKTTFSVCFVEDLGYTALRTGLPMEVSRDTSASHELPLEATKVGRPGSWNFLPGHVIVASSEY